MDAIEVDRLAERRWRELSHLTQVLHPRPSGRRRHPPGRGRGRRFSWRRNRRSADHRG